MHLLISLFSFNILFLYLRENNYINQLLWLICARQALPLQKKLHGISIFL